VQDGDAATKQAGIDVILAVIRSRPAVYKIFGEQWQEPEYYSVVMQPFIISPMINVADIAVTVGDQLARQAPGSPRTIDESFLSRCIALAHPFPVLERYEAETNTQYFIPLDELTMPLEEQEKLVFGFGDRRCLGASIAMTLMKSLFGRILERNELRFEPRVRHLYSGRNNDGNDSVPEILYQFKSIAKLIIFANK
jgi:hypothetical protein